MSAPEERLYVFLNAELMGSVFRCQGKLSFRYDSVYLRNGPRIPLSLSMPLVQEAHDHARVNPFLWGLLPDNDALLQRWASRFQISASNPFGLLREIGEDCAGAIRFIREDRLDAANSGGKKPLTEADIGRRLAELKRDPALGRAPEDRGQFSLAGAQAKTALQKVGSRWFLPWGTEPTTHILKPPRPDLDGHIEDEHFCLELASRLGLRTATSAIADFDGQTAIVVKRYDRQYSGDHIVRVHQEDMCQALSVHPADKYESSGGPGIRSIMALLNQSSEPHEDRDRFMRGIVFNYLIVGSDAHAKNYSLLLGAGERVRLAPLYDVASLLTYAYRPPDRRFAMRIDRAYRDDQIFPHHFDAMARRIQYPVGRLRGIIDEYIEKIPRVSTLLCEEFERDGIHHPIIHELTEHLHRRCERLHIAFQSEPPTRRAAPTTAVE